MFWRGYHRDVWLKFFFTNLASPNNKFCIEPSAEASSMFVSGLQAVVIIQSVTTGMDFDLVRSFLPKLPIKVFDQIALQRIQRIVSNDAHNQNAGNIFRKDWLALEKQVI